MSLIPTPSATLLLAADKLLDHYEYQTAERILRAILTESPAHPEALRLYHKIHPPQAEPGPYVEQDYHTGMFVIKDDNEEHLAHFATEAEALKQLKRMKG